MTPNRPRTRPTREAPRASDAPSVHHVRLAPIRYGQNPAYGQNPIYSLGGAVDVGYGYGGRAGHGEAEEHPQGLHHGPDEVVEPWPEQVYARHRQEQLDVGAGIRAAADAAIHLGAEVRARLDGHEGIETGAIVVVTDGGAVTLYGEVADDASRRLASDLVAPIWGVTAVHNLLRTPEERED